MKVVIVLVVGCMGCHLVAAQGNTCSDFCSALGTLQTNPGDSCDDIYQNNRGASGNYWIDTGSGVQQVYCDMELDCGGQTGGWLRIADLNTTRGDDCPSGWTKITTPVAACIPSGEDAGCYATDFSTLNVPYDRICGMVVGYQSRTTDGFSASRSSGLINEPYVDGVSLTYGNPRNHIWTFAIGFADRDGNQNVRCPCSVPPGPQPPSFVSDNYYCEAGRLSGNNAVGEVMGVYIDDPVWDGDGCSNLNMCCSDPSLPWFYRQLSMIVTDDIEARLCRDETSRSEDILVREFQLYIQ